MQVERIADIFRAIHNRKSGYRRSGKQSTDLSSFQTAATIFCR